MRLVCPLCGVTVVEGVEAMPGECPGCGALYAGGGPSPPAALTSALAHWGVEGLSPDALAAALFSADPPAAPAPGAAITSDERDGFYAWWVFVRGDPADVLARAEGDA